MTATATIVLSIIGTGIGVVGIVGFMVRMLATRIDGITTRVGSLAAETNRRFDGLAAETNRRFETLTNDMHQHFEQVNRELGENWERMAKLEGALEGFLAGRRDGTRRDAGVTRRDEGPYWAYSAQEQRSPHRMHRRSNAAGLLPRLLARSTAQSPGSWCPQLRE